MLTGKQIKAVKGYQDIVVRLNQYGTKIDFFARRNESGNCQVTTIEDGVQCLEKLDYPLSFVNQVNHEWQAFLALLRPSDTVRFFSMRNSNQYVTEAGMVVEQFHANILRRGKKKQFTVLLSSNTVPDDYFGLSQSLKKVVS